MEKTFILYDRANRFEIPETIFKYAIAEKNNTINTREKVISVLFGNLSLPFRGDYFSKLLTFLKKYASAETPKTSDELDFIISCLSKDKCPDETIESLDNGCKRLVQLIESQNNANTVFQRLFSFCNFVNFRNDRLFDTLQNTNFETTRSKELLIIMLVRHAIANYQTNMTKFYCYRMYQEALTLTPGSGMQKQMYKTVADICKDSKQNYEISCHAAMQYANLIYNQNYTEAYYYFRYAATKLPSAFWEIGFLIEHHHLEQAHVREFSKELDIEFANELECISIVSRDSLPMQNTIDRQTVCPIEYDSEDEEYDLIVCFKLYWAITQRFRFTKALNSIAKLFLAKRISLCSFQNNHIFILDSDSADMAIDYLFQAMSLGNTNALVNLADYYFTLYKQSILPIEKERLMINYLHTAADEFSEPKACTLLGDYYFLKQNLKSANKYFSESIKHTNKSGYDYFMLGRIADINMQCEDALDYYGTALSLGYYDSAYYSALIWFNNCINDKIEEAQKALSITKVKNHLEKYLSLFSCEIQLKSLEILNVL